MQTVAETPTFSRQADKLFREDEKRDLIDYLARNPLTGDEIPGTEGVRKLRYAMAGGGSEAARESSTTTWTNACRCMRFSPTRRPTGRT